MKKNVTIRSFLLGILKCVVYFGIWYGITTIVTSFVVSSLSIANPGFSTEKILDLFMPYATAVSGLSGAIFVVVMGLLYRHKGVSMLDRVKLGPCRVSLCYNMLIFGASFMFVINLVLMLLQLFAPSSWFTSFEENSTFGIGNRAIETIAVCIVAPICEEILFRGLIAKKLREIMPSWLAIILSSLVFGLMHNGMIGFIYATICGAVMCIIYFRTGSLLASMLFHLAFNLTSLLVAGVSIPLYVFILSAVITVGELIFIFINYRGFNHENI